jgi:hypothetical protein
MTRRGCRNSLRGTGIIGSSRTLTSYQREKALFWFLQRIAKVNGSI